VITDFRAYVKSILIEMEGAHIDGSSPHKAAFGTFGKSGLTYGEMQNDVGQGDADVVPRNSPPRSARTPSPKPRHPAPDGTNSPRIF